MMLRFIAYLADLSAEASAKVEVLTYARQTDCIFFDFMITSTRWFVEWIPAIHRATPC